MPDLAGLWPFFLAALALNLTPGADMTYVIARTATQGRAAGVAASFGIAGGSFVHTALAAFGVSAILAHSEAAFVTVKAVGAAYLLFLAWKALKTGAARATSSQALPPIPLERIFAEGVLTNVLNPKVALFILAFLPQFVDPNAAGPVWLQILFLGTLFNISGTTVNCVVALSTAAAAGLVRGSASLGRWLNRLSALVFVGLAIRLALAERR
ncbi:MAG: LysE family translocator [Proteobacteria bacterium]|nr:LysE family translocator [Pseudomonadota bacterium]